MFDFKGLAGILEMGIFGGGVECPFLTRINTNGIDGTVYHLPVIASKKFYA